MKLHVEEVLEILVKAEDDVKNGRVAPINDTISAIRSMLQAE